MVGEHSLCVEGYGVSRAGAQGRENAGISSKKFGENPNDRKRKVSWATQIVPGLVGPKPRPKGVGDGRAG